MDQSVGSCLFAQGGNGRVELQLYREQSVDAVPKAVLLERNQGVHQLHFATIYSTRNCPHQSRNHPWFECAKAEQRTRRWCVMVLSCRERTWWPKFFTWTSLLPVKYALSPLRLNYRKWRWFWPPSLKTKCICVLLPSQNTVWITISYALLKHRWIVDAFSQRELHSVVNVQLQ